MLKDRKILITNDDGINADGLIRLAAEAAKYGKVYVVAPFEQRSAASHSLTLRKSVDVWKTDFRIPGVEAYACYGTPVDCVRIGILNIVEAGPDFVFSGINYGYNAATDLQYSATAGAAFEGAFQGVHSIAFSEGMCDNHEVTDHYLGQIIEELLEELSGVDVDRRVIRNVNFPGCSLSECGGILRDRKVSGCSFYRDRYKVLSQDGDKTTYMVDGLRSYDSEPDTDLRALYDNYVSVGLATNIS